MPTFQEKLTEKYYSYWILWKSAKENTVTLDFSERENGRFMAQFMYKELDNFRLHLRRNILKPWSQKMYETVEQVQLERRKDIIILKKRRFTKVRECRKYFLNNLPNKANGINI